MSSRRSASSRPSSRSTGGGGPTGTPARIPEATVGTSAAPADAPPRSRASPRSPSPVATSPSTGDRSPGIAVDPARATLSSGSPGATPPGAAVPGSGIRATRPPLVGERRFALPAGPPSPRAPVAARGPFALPAGPLWGVVVDQEAGDG